MTPHARRTRFCARRHLPQRTMGGGANQRGANANLRVRVRTWPCSTLGLFRRAKQDGRVLPNRTGGLRLFRFTGIDVYVHWSWFIVALFELNYRRDHYSSPFWNVAEYLALFLIVLLHEFGHALACRQTGGQADTIVLWPLGGVAYVAPPQRPGAMLWSIAAGPLVNLALLPVALGLVTVANALGWARTLPNAHRFLEALVYINAGLLFFNLLPVYPLDGGQILRSLLWFILGRTRSLTVATTLGLVGAAGFGALAFYQRSIWLGLLAFFMFTNCWRSLQQAQMLRLIESAPDRSDAACPSCQARPPLGPFWICHRCRTRFDTFATGGICPRCQQQFPVTSCPKCHQARPIAEWVQPSPTTERASG